MLLDWVVSLILIFLLQYIGIFIITFNNITVDALNKMINSISMDDVKTIYNKIGLLAVTGIGLSSLTATLVYCTLTFMTIAFFIAYVNRMLKVGFLIIISPLISITYSIDKMKDQKAQALDKWLKEFAFTILIQPFHCIMYFAFTNTAFTLLKPFVGKNPVLNVASSLENTILGTGDYNMLATSVLVIISLLFIKQAEIVVRKIFGFQDNNKSTSFAAGMAVSLVAVKNAKKIGKSARVGVNTAKEFASKLGPAVMNDFGKIKGSKMAGKIGSKVGGVAEAFKGTDIGKGASAIAGKAGGLMESAKNKIGAVKQSSFGKKISGARGTMQKAKSNASKKMQKFKGTKIGKFFNPARTLGSSAGIMAGMIALMDGNSPIEAIGEATAMKEGVNTFINTSEGRMADDVSNANDYMDEREYSKRKEHYDSQASDPNKDAAQESLDNIGISSADEFKRIAEIDYEANGDKTYAERAEEKKEKIKEIDRTAEERGSYTEEEQEQKELLEEQVEELEKFAKAESLIQEKEELDNFMNEDAIAERASNRMRAPKKNEIRSAVNELTKEILRIKSEKRRKGGASTSNVITEKESKDALTLTKSIEQIIQHDVLTDSNLDMEKLLGRYLGLSKKDEFYESALEKVNSVKDIYSRQKIASAYGVVNGVKGSRERLAKEIAKRSKMKN